MKDTTARKRIINAINREPLIKSEADKKHFFNLIYDDFLFFEAEESEEYTSTQNLNFAIAIWLYDGEAVIKNQLSD
jgi:hypothetical protein